MTIKASYTSVWDGGIRVTAPCEYDPDTKTVMNIEQSGVDGVEDLEDEYVTLPDGADLREEDGVTFDY
jgi:hypothetical protein